MPLWRQPSAELANSKMANRKIFIFRLLNFILNYNFERLNLIEGFVNGRLESLAKQNTAKRAIHFSRFPHPQNLLPLWKDFVSPIGQKEKAVPNWPAGIPNSREQLLAFAWFFGPKLGVFNLHSTWFSAFASFFTSSIVANQLANARWPLALGMVWPWDKDFWIKELFEFNWMKILRENEWKIK